MSDKTYTLGDGPYTLSSAMVPNTLAVRMGSGKSLLTIKADGTIDIGEGLSPDEAGKQAIDAMRHQLAFIIEQAKASVHREYEKRGVKIIDGSLHSYFDGRWLAMHYPADEAHLHYPPNS